MPTTNTDAEEYSEVSIAHTALREAITHANLDPDQVLGVRSHLRPSPSSERGATCVTKFHNARLHADNGDVLPVHRLAFSQCTGALRVWAADPFSQLTPRAGEIQSHEPDPMHILATIAERSRIGVRECTQHCTVAIL